MAGPGVDLGSRVEVGLDLGNPGECKGLHWGTDGAGRRHLLASPHSTRPRKMMIKRATASLYRAPKTVPSPLHTSSPLVLTLTWEARLLLSPFYRRGKRGSERTRNTWPASNSRVCSSPSQSPRSILSTAPPYRSMASRAGRLPEVLVLKGFSSHSG